MILYANDTHIRDAEGKVYTQPQPCRCLVIDQGRVIQERLPPLPAWDCWRILFHKWATTKGGFAAFSLVKEGPNTYLQGVHIEANDPLISWIKQAKRVRFAETIVLGQGFQMACYENRQLVFCGRRLLLARTTAEDPKRTIHFLARQFINIESDISVNHFSLSEFTNHLCASPARLRLLPLYEPRSLLVWTCSAVLLTASLVYSTVEVYRGFHFKSVTSALAQQICALHPPDPQALADLTAYHALQNESRNPLTAFEQLAPVIQKTAIKLDTLVWTPDHLEITFTLPPDNDVEDILPPLQAAFPKAPVDVVSAPYETFGEGIPQATVHVGLP